MQNYYFEESKNIFDSKNACHMRAHIRDRTRVYDAFELYEPIGSGSAVNDRGLQLSERLGTRLTARCVSKCINLKFVE